MYIVHDNSNQNAKPTKGEENVKLKEESFFNGVHEEMGIDFVTSKTFDNEYLKTAKNHHREKSPKISDNSNSQDISETRIELKKNHQKSTNFMCQFCDKPFLSRIQFKNHLNSHGKPIVFKCQYCEKSFESELMLKRHEGNIHLNTSVVSGVILVKKPTKLLVGRECKTVGETSKTNSEFPKF